MRYVLGFGEIDRTQVALVGGKGANLGELSRIEGIRVPPRLLRDDGRLPSGSWPRRRRSMTQLDRLSRLEPDDRAAIRALSAEIRRALGAGRHSRRPRGGDHAGRWPGWASDAAYAVRSSATAEDLPTASFAGQQDSYLNVVGPAAVLQHVRRCWASLFTERAVTYRLRNGFDHRKVRDGRGRAADGVPAGGRDPVHGRPGDLEPEGRFVEAGFGLGEALVSGLVNPDVYQVRDGEVVARAVAAKRLAILASPGGGTQEQAVAPERQEQPALTDAQVVRLARLGRRIEAHFGRPQDIEWCLVDDELPDRPEPADHHPVPRPRRPATTRTTSTSPSVTSR